MLNPTQIAELEAAVERVLKSGVARIDDTGKYLNVVSGW